MIVGDLRKTFRPWETRQLRRCMCEAVYRRPNCWPRCCLRRFNRSGTQLDAGGLNSRRVPVATLNHPNIIAIYDMGMEDNTPYIVTELTAPLTKSAPPFGETENAAPEPAKSASGRRMGDYVPIRTQTPAAANIGHFQQVRPPRC
jgi:hypothetical protein